MSRHHGFVFTNFDMEFEWVLDNGMDYVAYGLEKTKEGRDHQQGFCHFKNAKGVKMVRTLLKPMHVEIQRGTWTQNIKYCSKQNPLIELGEKPAQGRRSDLEKYMEEIKEGATEYTLANTRPKIWAQYGRRGEEYRRLLDSGERASNLVGQKRNWKTEVRVWWGPTGTGKTMSAIKWLSSELEGSVEVQLEGSVDNDGTYDDVTQQGNFLVGYNNREGVLFDDFEPGSMMRGMFLKLTDRYPVTVNVKYGDREFNARRLAITSNFDPKDWYAKPDAIVRRITEIHHCTEVAKGNPEALADDVVKE